MRDLAGRTVLEQIAELSSAEEFFMFFLLPFDQDVVNVSRLHILKRMGQYMSDTDFAGMDDDQIFLEARLHLKQAHSDFVESTPIQEKVFKVFKDQEAAQAAKFVSVDALSLAAE